MKTFKKILIWSVVVCAVFCLLSICVMQPLQTVNAENLLHDDHFEGHDDCGCIYDDSIYSCSFPEVSRVSKNLTWEDIPVLSDPNYVTPNPTAHQDEVGEGGGQRGSNPLPIKVLLVVDEEAEDLYNSFNDPYHSWVRLCMWVEDILWRGVYPLWDYYSIDYQVIGVEPWNSPNHIDYHGMNVPVVYNFTKATYGYDIIVLMTGQDDGIPGYTVQGVTFAADDMCLIDVNTDYYEIPYIVQHELSHLFGCAHHTPQSCVMDHGVTLITRYYCIDCHNTIWANRFKYDIIKGYVTNIAGKFTYGDASISNENNIKGAHSDGHYTTLSSGSSGYKAVLNVQMNPSSSSISGTIYLRGYTGSSGGNHLIIFKSLDGVNWDATPVKNTNFHSPNTPTDLNCGYVSNFKYLSIVVINDYNVIGTVYIDSIHVH